MGVRIRLKRLGAKRTPHYRIVVVDSRVPRDGRTIEEVGHYHPAQVKGQQLTVNAEAIAAWIKKGAQPSHTVRQLLKREWKHSQGQVQGKIE